MREKRRKDRSFPGAKPPALGIFADFSKKPDISYGIGIYSKQGQNNPREFFYDKGF
jgi:hypothetical protein